MFFNRLHHWDEEQVWAQLCESSGGDWWSMQGQSAQARGGHAVSVPSAGS